MTTLAAAPFLVGATRVTRLAAMAVGRSCCRWVGVMVPVRSDMTSSEALLALTDEANLAERALTLSVFSSKSGGKAKVRIGAAWGAVIVSRPVTRISGATWIREVMGLLY